MWFALAHAKATIDAKCFGTCCEEGKEGDSQRGTKSVASQGYVMAM